MQTGDYFPLRFAVRYPAQLSRWLNLPPFIGTLVKLVLAFPVIVVVGAISGGSLLAGLGESDNTLLQGASAASSVFLFAPFAILFTGRYPRGLWYLIVGLLRMQARISVYMASLSDRWPAFSLDEREDDVFDLEIHYPATLNRWLNFPLLGFIAKTIMVIPHLLILFFVGIAVFFVILYAQFVIASSGRFPPRLFDFVAGWLQLSFRVVAYVYSLTDQYPPFNFEPTAPRPGPV